MTLSEAAYKKILKEKDAKIEALKNQIKEMENGRKGIKIESLRNRIKELETQLSESLRKGQ